MQVTQTSAEGLTRQFKVVVPAQDIATRADAQLNDLKGKVRINGFRPGKVPVAHLKRLYGRSVMADILNEVVGEANKKIVEDNGIKLAMEPKVDLDGGDQGVEQVLDAKQDFAWTVSLELLPKVEVGDLSGLKITKPVAEVSDEEVDARIQDLAKRNRSFADREDGADAQSGDRLTIDFAGSIEGEAFEGGTATDTPIDLGAGGFIPGFEDQLLGAKVGDERTVTVTFPEDYGAKHLAGKQADFAVSVKGVQAPGELTIDDELAKGFGLDDLDKLKEMVRKSIQDEFDAASRRKVKRQLLDQLDSRYSFDLPPTLVEQEFAGVWRQVETDMKSSGKSFEDENTSEEASRAEYRKIAERRVRLGLVLAEVGEESKIQVPDEEVSRAVFERARQFPGQEKMVWDFYSKNPQALAEIRAPLFEDKVIDVLLGRAEVTETSVPKDELLKDDEDDSASIDPATESVEG